MQNVLFRTIICIIFVESKEYTNEMKQSFKIYLSKIFRKVIIY